MVDEVLLQAGGFQAATFTFAGVVCVGEMADGGCGAFAVDLVDGVWAGDAHLEGAADVGVGFAPLDGVLFEGGGEGEGGGEEEEDGGGGGGGGGGGSSCWFCHG